MLGSSCSILFLLAAAAALAAEDRLCLDAIPVTGAADVHVAFIGLQKNRQYDVSCRVSIGRNVFFADGESNNRRGSTLFWLRKQISGTCGKAGHISVCDSKRRAEGN